MRGRLVVEWVTISEHRLLYVLYFFLVAVLHFFFFWLLLRNLGHIHYTELQAQMALSWWGSLQ
ncbi:hypothetical protein J3E69DRAFT_314685 [Trichoderma sp. SZMC 28015]